MEFNLKILSRCFLKHYKDYIGEFSHNSQKLSELLFLLIVGKDISPDGSNGRLIFIRAIHQTAFTSWRAQAGWRALPRITQFR
jgi:hypothetical protein